VVDFRQRFFLAMLLWACVAIIALVARLAPHYFEVSKTGIHAELRESRSLTTRLQQRGYLIKDFAYRLRRDADLLAIVTSSSEDKSNWQSPIMRTRLRLMDALGRANYGADGAIDAVHIEWLEPEVTARETERPVLRAWLSSWVSTVGSGSDLLDSLSRFVQPFPLSAQGCRYRPISNGDGLDMRCLITLSAWQLPMLNLDHLPPESQSLALDQERASTIPPVIPHLSLFNRERVRPAQAVRVKTETPRRMPLRAVKKVVPQGVIKGPVGDLVIHEQ